MTAANLADDQNNARLLSRYALLPIAFMAAMFDPFLNALPLNPCGEDSFWAHDLEDPPHAFYSCLCAITSLVAGLLVWRQFRGFAFVLCVPLIVGQLGISLGCWNDNCTLYLVGWLMLSIAVQSLAVLTVSLVANHFLVWDLAFALGIIVCSGFLSPGLFSMVYTAVWGDDRQGSRSIFYSSAFCCIAILGAFLIGVYDLYSRSQGVSKSESSAETNPLLRASTAWTEFGGNSVLEEQDDEKEGDDEEEDDAGGGGDGNSDSTTAILMEKKTVQQQQQQQQLRTDLSINDDPAAEAIAMAFRKQSNNNNINNKEEEEEEEETEDETASVDLNSDLSVITAIRIIRKFPGQFWLVVVMIAFFDGMERPFDSRLMELVFDKQGPFDAEWFSSLAADLVALYYVEVMLFGPFMGMLVDRIGRRPKMAGLACTFAVLFHILFAVSIANWNDLPDWKAVFLSPTLLLSIRAVTQAVGTVALWSSLVMTLPSRNCIGLGIGVSFAAVDITEMLIHLAVANVSPFHTHGVAWTGLLFSLLCGFCVIMAVIVNKRDFVNAKGHSGILSLPSSRSKKTAGYTRLSSTTGVYGIDSMALMGVEVPDSRVVSSCDLKLEQPLGTGASATVFKARWYGSVVAAKRITSSKQDDITTWCDEIRTMAMLSHPNVVAFYGTSHRGPDLFILTEYCALGSLYRVIRDESVVLTAATRHTMAIDTAAGMSYLHSQNILHRDLKSLNLMVSSGLTIKVGDFGLARMQTCVEPTSSLGTVQWQAPEVFSNGYFSQKSDVFSYGVVLWEIFSPRDQQLYPGISPVIVALRVLEGERPHPLPIAPDSILRTMQSCWNKDPKLRPSFQEVFVALKSNRAPEVQSKEGTDKNGANAGGSAKKKGNV